MTLSTHSIVVLIPAYNAACSMTELVQRIRKAIGEVHIVVVDDGSTDETLEVATSLGVTVLQHKQNRGKGAALQTGFDFLKNRLEFDFILVMDSDLQHQPEDISKFFEAQQQTSADIVIGWRQRVGTKMPANRILSNTITSFMVRMRTGVTIKDSQCGFRLICRGVVEQIRLESTGYAAETEFLIKAAQKGFGIEFVPVNTVYGTERSYMTHWTTTKNFIKVLFRDYA
jgi:glycosyltransferase involved in cell wall biosynthesis